MYNCSGVIDHGSSFRQKNVLNTNQSEMHTNTGSVTVAHTMSQGRHMRLATILKV